MENTNLQGQFWKIISCYLRYENSVQTYHLQIDLTYSELLVPMHRNLFVQKEFISIVNFVLH